MVYRSFKPFDLFFLQFSHNYCKCKDLENDFNRKAIIISNMHRKPYRNFKNQRSVPAFLSLIYSLLLQITKEESKIVWDKKYACHSKSWNSHLAQWHQWRQLLAFYFPSWNSTRLLKDSGKECKLHCNRLFYTCIYKYSAAYTRVPITIHSIWYLPEIIFAKSLLICIKGAIICSCQLKTITMENKTTII